MNSALERLLSLRVKDVMTRQVVEVAASETMPSAGAKLLAHRISGAPVVNEEGRCVGVLSAFDFLRLHAEEDGWPAAEHELSGGGETPYSIEEDPSGSVERHMTSAIQTVQAEDTLMHAARIMCTEHIHRLIALDDDGRACGVLTALDITAALVQAIDE